MNPRLKEYLQRFRSVQVDESMLEDLRREMDEAIPEIAENIRQREELAAELRIAASRPAQSRKENRD